MSAKFDHFPISNGNGLLTSKRIARFAIATPTRIRAQQKVEAMERKDQKVALNSSS